MPTASSLTERIDAEFSAAGKSLDQYRAQRVQEYQDRPKQLERFEQTTLDELRKIREGTESVIVGSLLACAPSETTRLAVP
jgi:hypothetical protein